MRARVVFVMIIYALALFNAFLFQKHRYRPNLPIEFVQKELAYAERTKCMEFLQEKGVTFIDNNTKVDCKASMAILPSL